MSLSRSTNDIQTVALYDPSEAHTDSSSAIEDQKPPTTIIVHLSSSKPGVWRSGPAVKPDIGQFKALARAECYVTMQEAVFREFRLQNRGPFYFASDVRFYTDRHPMCPGQKVEITKEVFREWVTGAASCGLVLECDLEW